MPEQPNVDFNQAMDDDSEESGIRLIRSLFPRIDTAKERIVGEYLAVVEDRSSLRLDDRYLGRWRTGSLHVTALTSGLDALLVIRAILEPVLEREAPLPMSGLYPVLRAAIESAALAIYLLAPADRDTRLRRSYLVADEDAKYQGVFAKEMDRADWNAGRVAAQREIRELIGTRISLGAPSSFTFSGVKYSDVVERADAIIAEDVSARGRRSMSLLAWWQLLSGLSHGKAWAFLAAMERSEAIVDVENQSASVRMTSSVAAVALIFERAVEALEVAIRLFGHRSKSTYAQIEDASEPPTVAFSAMPSGDPE